MGTIPGSGRSPGGGCDNPLQYPCLENPMDRGAWQAIDYGVSNSQTRLKWLSMNVCVCVCVYKILLYFLFVSLLDVPSLWWEQGERRVKNKQTNKLSSCMSRCGDTDQRWWWKFLHILGVGGVWGQTAVNRGWKCIPMPGTAYHEERGIHSFAASYPVPREVGEKCYRSCSGCPDHCPPTMTEQRNAC